MVAQTKIFLCIGDLGFKHYSAIQKLVDGPSAVCGERLVRYERYNWHVIFLVRIVHLITSLKLPRSQLRQHLAQMWVPTVHGHSNRTMHNVTSLRRRPYPPPCLWPC